MMRRGGVGIAGAALLVLLSFGCGGGSKPGSSGTDRTAPVTITFWQFWDSGVVRPLVDRFEAENPGIKVDMQQLTWQNGKERILASVPAGTSPDLCELGSTWFAQFAANNALSDLTAAADSLKNELRMWEAVTYEGRIYGIPWVMGTRALFYNRKLFREAGLDPDQAPRTWPELVAAVRAVHDPAKGIYGFGRNAGERYVLFKKFMPFAWSLGGNVLAADGKTSIFNSPANVTALKFYLDLGKYAITEKQDILDQAFKQGKVGVLISGAWLFKTIPVEAPSLEYGVGLIPRPDDPAGAHRSFGGGEVLVIFRGSKHPAEALKLARFLARGANAMVLARAVQSVEPAAAGVENDPWFKDNPGQLVFLNQLSQAVFPPNVPQWSDIESVVDKWVEKALYGQATPEQAVQEADKEITTILQGRR